MSFSFIIIDEMDVPPKDLLRLFENFPNYYCAGVSKDSQNATNQIIKLKPQLVFVSIPSKPSEHTFHYKNIEELFQFAETMPYFIAINENETGALEAVQAGVSDFIIGSLNVSKLGKCLFKFEKRSPQNTINSICIKSHSDYQFVALQDIVYLKADNNTTDIKLHNDKIINAFKTLKHFENTLPFYFLRIHKSYIVNIHYVSRIHFSKFKCYINYNEILPFSTSYRENIDAIIRKINI